MDILGLNKIDAKTLVQIIKDFNKTRIIIVGGACSGKDYLKNILKSHGFDTSISYTTRRQRESETIGIDYFFIDDAKFMEYVSYGYFYEWTDFNGSKYGTTHTEWNAINPNKIFIMTPQPLEIMSDKDRSKCLVIYLKTNDEERMNRMLSRGASETEINDRLSADDLIYKDFTNYDICFTDLTIQ